MKKILFLFLMFMGLMSSLYALDTLKIGCDVEKSQALEWGEEDYSPAIDVAFMKVDILLKDGLPISSIAMATNRKKDNDMKLVHRQALLGEHGRVTFSTVLKTETVASTAVG